MKQIIALICCRGNSKGLRNKNIIQFNGRPMLYWIFREIFKTKIFSKIILSTDNKEIFKIGKKIGFEIKGLRPKKLALDNSNVFETHKYEFKNWGITDKNSIVCVINNNPFITSKLIKKTYLRFKKNKFKNIVHLSKEIVYDQIYYRQCEKKGHKLIHKFKKELVKSKINRNQIKKVYYNLGDIRWAKVDLLSNFKKYNLNIVKYGNLHVSINKLNYIDINNKKDLLLAEKIFKNDTNI